MKKNIVKVAVIFVLVLCLGISAQVAAQSGTAATIRFTGGSCQIAALNLRPMFAPADMKESEKAFMVQFKYTLDTGVTDEALRVLFSEGRFAAADGKTYKAGSALLNDTDSVYSLIVAVPQDIVVETLNFTFNKQTVALKQ